MTKKAAIVAFVISAVVALAVHYFMFEMRYMWYVSADDAQFMRMIYGACVGAILLLWAFFPSRIVVALVGAFALFFPHFFYTAAARPLLGRAIDGQGMAVAGVAIGLLVLATHLRRKSART